jgi:hypothetical protein
MYKGLFFIKRLIWKFIRSFACVDSDMAKAKLPLPFDVAPQKKWWDRKATNIQLKKNYYCVI